MKKTVKITMVVSVLLLTFLALTGCANAEKKKAFLDYQASLGTDEALMNAASEDMEKVQDAINKRDLTTVKAVLQSRVNPTLKQLSTNATNRHATIADPELANIDTHYVNYANHISDAFTLMLDAINTEDQAKMNTSMTELNVCMNELNEYVSGMQKYMNDYGIKDGGALEEVKAMLGN